MTTRSDHHEPLDEQERDLAARLGRAGPIDGPSPALDARILAAAHAAAATDKPRRHGRLAWFGVPPAMITGVGVAAAAVLALGLVWQLRPQYGRTVAQAGADAGEEVIIFAEPSSAPRPQKTNPPPPQDAVARDSSAEPPRSAAAADAAAVAQSNAAERAAAERAAIESAKAAEAEADLIAQSIDRAAPAPEAEAAAAAAGNIADAQGFTPEPPAAAPAMARKSRATYTTAARATAERRERAQVAAAAPAAPAPAAADASAESTTLDRIEVTGSRIGLDTDWSQVPVNDDTRLPAAEWLERVRARRDGEDLDNARASLRLFHREYPRVRIPDDLRALLAAPTQR